MPDPADGENLNVSKKKTRHHYGLGAAGLLLLALALGSQPLAATFQVPHLSLVAGLVDDIYYYDAVALGVLLVLAGLLYVRNLDPYVYRRSRFLVFLNWLAPSAFATMAFAAWGLEGGRGGGNLAVPLVAGIGAAILLLPPLLLMAGESLAERSCRALGGVAHNHTLRGVALLLLKISLACRPGNLEVRRLCGLLYMEEDDCGRAMPLLEPLGPLAESKDEERLRAMERCYRAHGQIEQALECLLRLRQLRAEPGTLDRRILEDYLKLERRQEALDLLESGSLKQTVELVLIAQQLNLELGNFAQAVAQIHQVAEMEGLPYTESVRLYKELIERLPDNLELRINLGQLLMTHPMEQRRREGAMLLEEAFEEGPQRLHLAHQLIKYYGESDQPAKLRDCLKQVVEAGDTDPDNYLAYAHILASEDRTAEVIEVFQRMVEVLPEDWRGHLRLARAYFLGGELDRAEHELGEAERHCPEEADPLLKHLRADLDQRRREQAILSMTEELSRNREDVEKRLSLIDHLIGIEWVDQALSECDTLLAEFPRLMPAVEERIAKGASVGRSFLLRDYLADLYFQQGRYDEMIGLLREMAEQALHPAQVMVEGCRKILARTPEHIEARRELALACREEENWAGILEALDPLVSQGIALPAEDQALWVESCFRMKRLEDAARVGVTLAGELAEETGFMLMLIDILQELGDFDAAYDVYQKARAAAPEHERLRRLERRVMTNRSKFRLEALERRLEKEGQLSATEHMEMGELHRELGQFAEAIVHYQQAAKEDRLADIALAKMAVSLCEHGMYDLAQETIEPLELTSESVAEHPELKEMIYQVARTLEKIKRPHLALKYYKRIFHVDAAYEDVVKRLERLS